MSVGKVSFANVDYSRYAQPVNFKSSEEQPIAQQPNSDEKMSDAAKWAVGATALAGVITLGILGYKGHLGGSIQKFMGGIDKETQNAAKALGLKAKDYVKLKKEFDAITKQDGKLGLEKIKGKLRDLVGKGVLKETDEVYVLKSSDLENEILKELNVKTLPENSSILYIAEQGLKKKKHVELILHEGLADDLSSSFVNHPVVKLNIVE